MKKLLLLSLCMVLLFFGQSYAQDRTVTGTVTGKDDGQPLPGVVVKIKGTQSAVSTDGFGKYSIKAPANSALVFSFIGYVQLEAAAKGNVLNVALEPNVKQLGEVVVTALGTRREKKSLGYAQTTVTAEQINASSSINLFSGIQGKVAGVNISNTSGSPGGSTKVIIRSFSSITGSNQPLYIVDGVPIDNSRPGSDNNFDFGNNANDIDPNSIESMSILKGSAATALYGSRGSNGVILITTKRGKAGKPVVDVTLGTTLTSLASVYNPQKVFGQGWDSQSYISENGNWGPKFDGVVRPWGAIVNNSQLLKPFSYVDNNVKNAFDTGFETNNQIALSGGNETSTYYMSYGNVYSNGILPTSNDSYKRNNFSLKGSTSYKGFTAEASMNYVSKASRFVATGQGDSGIGAGFYEEILQIPGNIPIRDLRDYKNRYFNVDNYFTPFAENPYYVLNENGSRYRSDRIYGNINLNYKANKWLSFQIQQGVDVNNAGDKIWHNVNSPVPGSWNGGDDTIDPTNPEGAKRAADVGNVIEESFKQFEYDSKLNALFNTTITSDFDVNGLVGVNYNDRGTRSLYTEVQGLTIPGFYQLSNTSNLPTASESETHRRLLGVYGQATFGYKRYLYLTLTGRNDWSSTLPKGGNSYFYPGASLAYNIIESLGLQNTAVSSAKLRASYGKTGSDTDPYRIINTLNATNVVLGFGNNTLPFNGVPGYTINNQLNNGTLKPETQTELELGAEANFFKNRLGFDFTYYARVKKDQILPVATAPSSGYTTAILNFGKVRNRGIELAIHGTPIQTKTVTWDVNYNFTRNRNLVLELNNGLEKAVLTSAYDAQFAAIAGQPLGVFLAPVPVYDPEGRIVVNNQGFPVTSTALGNYGTSQSDFQMGLSNSIRVKNFALSFTFDWRQGGRFYSGTADLLNFVGADQKTLYNDRRPFIVPNSVQAVAGPNGTTTYVENTTPISEINYDDYYYTNQNKGIAYQNRILDKTFVKLRELTLSYTLPVAIAQKIGAQRAMFTVFGRNLYTWLPKRNQTIDPEVSNQGIDLTSEFGEFRTAPPLRYFGASLKVSF
ncbi:SusC/RagA family TonB-linked outer membrane protein [Mucilaginibacter sp. PAMB04168]|uniref:SusC/RagA family TonB-linked outer membrane protein n=1 Tax=Mucilaginibacter sp. PAMB04168 TaxID=3138567 RepID=UPI0031F659EF